MVKNSIKSKKKYKKKSIKKQKGGTNSLEKSNQDINISFRGNQTKLKCSVCGNNQFSMRKSKIPTGSRARDMFFGESDDMFESRAKLLTCYHCGTIIWLNNNVEMPESFKEEPESSCVIM